MIRSAKEMHKTFTKMNSDSKLSSGKFVSLTDISFWRDKIITMYGLSFIEAQNLACDISEIEFTNQLAKEN